MRTQEPGLESRCDLLRSLHRAGDPLLLPNAWDAATARTVVAAGFPVVATSWGVSEALGYEDDEKAPADEMLAAAGRIARSVDVPVTVDAEAGYGMEPGELVRALQSVGAAGCNLEDTDHSDTSLRDPDRHAEWLRAVRQAADDEEYPLVINARVDVFLWPYVADPAPGSQEERAHHAGGASARGAGRPRRRPRELGALPVLGRDGSLQRTAGLAHGVRGSLTAGWAAPRAQAPSRARSRRPSPSPATRAAGAAPRTP